MRHNHIALGIIVVSALLLQGCGKKGPLTFPVPQKFAPQQSSMQQPVTQP